MAYVVEVVPPVAGEAVFEVEEPDYASACYRALRYRKRGYGASVALAGDRPLWWRVEAIGYGLPPLTLRARTSWCALLQARRLDWRYDSTQVVREEVTA